LELLFAIFYEFLTFRYFLRSFIVPPVYAYSFIPSVQMPRRLPIAHRLAALLLSDRVQEISFTFGSVVTLPEGFRAVAAALIRGDIRVTTDPNLVPIDAYGEYDKSSNVIHLTQDDVLDFPHGRSVAIHESCHALHDIRGRRTSVRSEESAARIAQAWYLFSCIEPRPSTTPEAIWDAALQIRSRGVLEGRPAHATWSEITACRSAVAPKYTGYYANNGV
jgi:hypothetical protein